jgi:Fe-Mn family superoxide dismutase
VNTTLDKLADARAAEDLGAIVGLQKTLAFNLSGHVRHSLFWRNLSPNADGRPTGDLAHALDEHFGSFDAFHKQLSKAAGWCSVPPTSDSRYQHV